MPYELGIDMGTTATAAAVRHEDGRTETLPLGALNDSMPTVVHLQQDGTLTVGDPARRWGALDSAGAARGFLQRLGDPAPLLLRTTPYAPGSLVAQVVASVLARAEDRFGERPRRVAATVPGSWGDFKRERFAEALTAAGLADVDIVTAGEAAALAHGTGPNGPGEGAVVAVYDLGGTTFEATVLRRRGDRFEQLGDVVALEGLGGAVFDDAVFGHVRRAIGERWPSDPSDPSLPAPMLQVRRACTEAKEALSTERDVDIAVVLPGVDTTVALERQTFEQMIGSRIDESVDALGRALRLAGVSPSDLHAVLPVGGSSLIPLVRGRLAAWYPLRPPSEVDPVLAAARGAALVASAAERAATGSAPAEGPRGPTPPASTDAPAAPAAVAPPPEPPAAAAAAAAVPTADAAQLSPTAPAPTLAAPAPPPPDPAPGPPPEPGPPGAVAAAPSGGSAPASVGRWVWAAIIAGFAVMALAGPYTMLRDDEGGSGGYGGLRVTMAPTRFSPATLVVPRGSTVVFDNDDVVPHTVTAEDGSVDSGILDGGERFELVVDEPFAYICQLHANMRASIEIEG